LSHYEILATIPGNVLADVALPASDATSTAALVDGKICEGRLTNGWLTVTNIGPGQHSIRLASE
jgi:hypothetical protein